MYVEAVKEGGRENAGEEASLPSWITPHPHHPSFLVFLLGFFGPPTALPVAVILLAMGREGEAGGPCFPSASRPDPWF